MSITECAKYTVVRTDHDNGVVWLDVMPDNPQGMASAIYNAMRTMSHGLSFKARMITCPGKVCRLYYTRDTWNPAR